MTLEEYGKSQGVSSGLVGSGAATGGDLTGYGNIPAPPANEHVCPNCGYCPHCGRGWSYPIYPPPWPNYPQPYIGDYPGWMEWNKIYC